MKTAISFILLLFCSQCVIAKDRPSIGLVLSGGGARGGAHIGVIEVLEQYQIPIDIIVGTSMGAVIGGLYASGVPIEKIKHDFVALDWQDLFSYDIQRENLYYRRKYDNDLFLLKNFISYSNKQIHLPWGIITGQNLYEIFNRYILVQRPVKHFNELSIPFKAVATDLITGEPVILDKGDLALSMLASMAVPGIISPIQMNNYLLVDGGVSANLPIEVAKKMGADILIVVDVSTPLYTRKQISDLTSVLQQLTNIMSYGNVKTSERSLTAEDILIVPNLTDITTSDFTKFDEAIAPGRTAALLQGNKLEYLSSDIHLSLFRENDPIRINAVEIKEDKVLCPKTYHYYLDVAGKTVTAGEITDKIDELYGLSIFERVYYGVNDGVLTVIPDLKYTDPKYIQGSVLLDSDFQTNNNFALVVGITNPQVNRYLGEWRLIGRIGEGFGGLAEFYQPLDPTLKWFINPSVSIFRNPFSVFYDYERLAMFLNTTSTAGISFGRVFGNVARLQVFTDYEYNDFEQKTGTLNISHLSSKNFQAGAAFDWDKIDNVYFPHHGIKGKVEFTTNSHGLSNDAHFNQLTVQNIAAFSLDKHAFVLGGRYHRTLSGDPSLSSLFALGGLFELTGLANNEVMGRNAGLLTGIYYYELAQISLIPNRPSPFYLGGSFEWGKVWGFSNLSINHSIFSGSVFAGLDSLIGPIYLAFGLTDNNHKALHLMLRPPFG